jgi:hypothetical protein
MKPITTPEQAKANVAQFEELVSAAGITQLEAAEMIASQTDRPCSVRTVRSWLNDPAKPSWRPCPDWAVRALEKQINASKKAAK